MLPVLPVPVPYQHRDRRSERLSEANPGDELRAVGLDLHAATAAVSPHPPLQVRIDVALHLEREARGNPFEDGREPPAVGLTRSAEGHAPHVDDFMEGPFGEVGARSAGAMG